MAGDEVMPEMHLRQPRFTYSACQPYQPFYKKIYKNLKISDIFMKPTYNMI